MRLTKAAKQKITERIRACAAAEFRARGFAEVNLDQVMQRAGLTRGAFYAHYASKAALFEDVLRHEHPILRMLQDRPGPDSAALLAQMRQIFADYLTPSHHAQVFAGCSLAALSGEAAFAHDAGQAAFGAAFQDILTEMARGQAAPPAGFTAPLTLASGAVTAAAAVGDTALKTQILSESHAAFDRLIIDLTEQTA